MGRLLIIISPLTLILTLLFNSAPLGKVVKSNSCLKCHEDVYMKAVSSRYKHSIVREKCPMCHISPESSEKVKASMNFYELQSEWIVYLDQLPEDQKYQAEVIATDSNGRSCEPNQIDIVPGNLWEHSEQRPSLKLHKLSRVTIDEIKKRGFVRAVISWDTDTYATSEIEYRLRGERGRRLKLENQFTKKHKIVLDGLRHKSRYYFKAISRDIYGNTLESPEYTLDTSAEFSLVKEPAIKDDPVPPVIRHLQIFKKAKDKGLYLKVSLNKPSELSIKIKEPAGIDDKHGFGLLPARYARIDICYKCHPHDTSHPVGVKASGPKIRTPKDLPTIEDGVITCVTCHNPHGGKRKYFARYNPKRDICVMCHTGGY